MAYWKMTQEEKGWITVAILKQKIANNCKAEVLYEEHRERRTEAATAARDATTGATNNASSNVGSPMKDAVAESPKVQGDTILLRIARVATGATVRCNRTFKTALTVKKETYADGKRKRGKSEL